MRSTCPVERECIDVILPHLGAQQKVGRVNIELLAAIPLRKTFTVNLYFDDKEVPRRDKAVNQPVYFYVQGEPSALELVVTKVGEGRIAGYLSAPTGFLARSQGGGIPGSRPTAASTVPTNVPTVTPAGVIPTVTVLDVKLEPDRFKGGRIRVRGYFGNVWEAMGAFTLHEGNAYIYVRFDDDLPPAEKRKLYTTRYGTRVVVTVKVVRRFLGSSLVAESIQPE